jgi:chitinase
LRDISPQWDVILVAFATPDNNAPEGTLQFRPGTEPNVVQLKEDIAWLKSQGKKVMISLGGGGQYFKLDDPASISNFVSSVSDIVTQYGFEGIDLDFETPSLVLDPGDTDFKHPKTRSIVNLISALRELHDRLGPNFMISLVPEGTQIPAGYTTYGGQFGSYLPLLWGVRDILSFVDVQDYNTPPLQGLDGEIYQLGSVDYHVAMTELLLHGFYVADDPNQFFQPIPGEKVAVGFLVGAITPEIVSKSMDSIITGNQDASATYRLREPDGYPGMIGAMFWTINADAADNLSFSNRIGPQLHAYPPATRPRKQE